MNEEAVLKSCSECGVAKPSTLDYFPRRTGKQFKKKDKLYLRADCRDCYNRKRRHSIRYQQTSMINACKRRAKKRGLEATLKREDVYFPKYCPVLNIKLEHGRGNWETSPNIDRIDNTKGYTKDNIIVVSGLANNIKSSATPDQIYKVAEFYDKLYKDKKINSTETLSYYLLSTHF